MMNQDDIKLIDARDKFPKKRFSMPNDFPKEAKELWRNIEPWAWKNGLITEQNLSRFIEMCLKYTEWINLSMELKKQDHVLYSKSGLPRVNPLFAKTSKLSDRLLKLYDEFGMSPLSRAKKGIPEPEDSK
ncbi:MAG: P27 family phage terminase small subunit [Desulfobacteraceae bacterium]|nr:P27 family phage terminase small subunit [Desulfobacteraceae bacterium]